MKISISLILVLACSASCGPRPGPDKSVGGAILGAGWGAGAGAVVGHQLDAAGQGVAVGAGFGAAAGLMTGLGLDASDSAIVREEEELASLRVQNLANARELSNVQGTLDRSRATLGVGVYQVFFDPDATSLRLGAIANLETIAESLKSSAGAFKIKVDGHSDDAGLPDYNQRLAEARARAVASYLAARGISVSQIDVNSFGSSRPIASNATPVGRQLNRRVDVYIDR